jgi:uncharacterized oligopeptide transporter (OPT) family protein
MMIWMVVCSVLGVLVAFPLKRRFINEDQLPFQKAAPAAWCSTLLFRRRQRRHASGKTAGSDDVVCWRYQFLISDGWMRLLEFKLLQMDKWAGMKEAWHLQERFDEYYYMAAVI